MRGAYSSVLDGFNFSQKRTALIKRAGEYSSTIRSRNYASFNAIRNAVSDGKVQVLEAIWRDYRANIGQSWDKPNIEKEITYQECVFLNFQPSDLTVEIRLHNGDMCHGRPKDERCVWKVQLNEEIAELLFGELVDADLIEYLESDQEAAEAKRRAIEMRSIFEAQYVGDEPIIEEAIE